MKSIRIEQSHPTLRLNEDALRSLIQHILDSEGCSVTDLGIILTNHEAVLELNRTYLNRDYLTDVLAFDLSDEGRRRPCVVDGEVYIDLDTAQERAPEFGVSFEDEARRYVAHGLLHLIGYTDETAKKKAHMHHLEDHYLSLSSSI